MDATARPRSRKIAPSVPLLLMVICAAGCSESLNSSTTIEARFASLGHLPETDPAGNQPARLQRPIPTRPVELADPRQHTPLYSPGVSRDATVQTLAFPTGRVETSVVMLHQVSPRVADRDQPFTLEYHVTNLTQATLDEVEVHLHRIENLTLLDCSVHPSLTATTMFWSLGQLGPGQTRVVRVSAKAISTGPSQTDATVTYQNTLRSQTAIVEPILEITKAAPAYASPGDVFELEYTLTNSGTGTAKRITIDDKLPDGVTTLADENHISLPVLALGPGQTERRSVGVRAVRTGSFSSAAEVNAQSDIRVHSQAPRIEILDPVITLSGGLWDRVDSEVTYRLRVENTGRVLVRFPRVTIPLGGAIFLGATGIPSESASGLASGLAWGPALVLDDKVTLGCEPIKPGQIAEFEIVLRVPDGARGPSEAVIVATHTSASRVRLTEIPRQPLTLARLNPHEIWRALHPYTAP